MGLRYNVDKSQSTWKVTFEQRSYIRHHTSPSHAPYADMWINAHSDIVNVAHGQWLEGRQSDGGWALLSDADNR